MSRDVVVTLPTVCDHADVLVAHEQMRAHRACRVQWCAWKAAAHQTLVSAGRLTPQTVSPRERAAARGIRFPPPAESGLADRRPTASTLRELLERLSELATPPERLGW
ncbi:hypothetical protein AB0M45_26605 [Nocardia sp. NPDC051787]|uniref:hypothetical protein n=1 Tax=Nocardia sp. NPDC051787 TaxID=3155415 RepID=UPI00342C97FE